LVCHKNGWRCTDEVVSFVSSCNSRIIQTQLVEDGFNRQKNKPRYANGKGALRTAYATLIDEEVLNVVHKFDSMRGTDACVLRGRGLQAGAGEQQSVCLEPNKSPPSAPSGCRGTLLLGTHSWGTRGRASSVSGGVRCVGVMGREHVRCCVWRLTCSRAPTRMPP
jgi:hypothetical protein